MRQRVKFSYLFQGRTLEHVKICIKNLMKPEERLKMEFDLMEVSKPLNKEGYMKGGYYCVEEGLDNDLLQVWECLNDTRKDHIKRCEETKSDPAVTVIEKLEWHENPLVPLTKEKQYELLLDHVKGRFFNLMGKYNVPIKECTT